MALSCCLELHFIPSTDSITLFVLNAQHRLSLLKMSKTLDLELPWHGTRQMVGDIAGFIVVTLLLIVIDSYILCEHQNTLRIILSISIDYAILSLYIAARNFVMPSGADEVRQTQFRATQNGYAQHDHKWAEAKRDYLPDCRPMATQ